MSRALRPLFSTPRASFPADSRSQLAALPTWDVGRTLPRRVCPPRAPRSRGSARRNPKNRTVYLRHLSRWGSFVAVRRCSGARRLMRSVPGPYPTIPCSAGVGNGPNGAGGSRREGRFRPKSRIPRSSACPSSFGIVQVRRVCRRRFWVRSPRFRASRAMGADPTARAALGARAVLSPIHIPSHEHPTPDPRPQNRSIQRPEEKNSCLVSQIHQTVRTTPCSY